MVMTYIIVFTCLCTTQTKHLQKIQGTGANAGKTRMSGPPPGLQRKKAMDSDAKTATLKVTCEYVCFGVCLIATCQCLNGK